MALRVDIPRYLLEQALEATIASMKRAANTSKRPEFQEFYKRDHAILTMALASITEIPDDKKK